MNALTLLKADHQRVKDLFAEINSPANGSRRKQIFDRIDAELTVHSHIEETVFYPEMEHYDELRDAVEESIAEHQEVAALLDEIEALQPDQEEFQTALDDLIENVGHHIRFEEEELFPQVHELCDETTLEQLGEKLGAAKGHSPERRAAI